jgi:Fe-S oxidoreductase
LANFLLRAPGVSRVFKAIGGIAAERTLPQFASETFRDWFFARPPGDADKPAVVLWPDTFNNYLHPEPLKDAVAVLESIGYTVRVPRPAVCCARPLYAEGMLDLARHQLRDSMRALATEIDRGLPVVGLEPSCIASFRDELPNLFPGDERAHWLSRNTFLLSEFLDRIGYAPPTLKRKALVHAHCHHHAVIGTDAEKHLLDKLGMDVEFLDAGCCGMAGSFGFESEHYDLSRRVGELRLFPALRAEPDATVVAATGVSCRQQIAHFTGRRARHPVQIVRDVLERTPKR